ncbi:MAG: mannose-6-phosphate isomerase-like protein (cupin superfamily) [Candidatus Paceibacteria bacterium]|jgi:mannose-6-phosphate isomerase-like protein (cupin superfamily)
MKKGFITNIEQETLENTHFRKVLYTGEHSQLVVMSLNPGEDIGKEIHASLDQFIRIESGSGLAYINGNETVIQDDDAVIIPAGAEHNITNTGTTVMKLYTIYGPAEHKDAVIQSTKEIAETRHNDEQFNGETTE